MRTLATGLMVGVLSLLGCSSFGSGGADENVSSPSTDGGPDDGGPDGAVGPITDDGSSTPPACSQDLSTDAKNCGRCSHDCLGGTCAQGLCQPVTLAIGQGEVDGLATDGKSVFWGGYSNHNVSQCALPSCGQKPTLLATQPRTTTGFVVDANAVYWSAWAEDGQLQSGNGALLKCFLPGCPGGPRIVVSGLNRPQDLLLDKTDVYFAELLTVGRCQVGCGNDPGVKISTAKGGGHLVKVADSIYFLGQAAAGDSALYRCSSAGCGATPDVLAAGMSQASGLATDGTSLYVSSAALGTILKCSLPDCADALQVVASGRERPTNVTVHGSRLYWTESSPVAGAGGSVSTCSLPDCKDAHAIVPNGVYPNALTFDTVSVLWSDDGDSAGSIRRLALP